MRRFGNHAVINEEKTLEVQKHLGTGWYVYTNNNGSDVLLHDFAGSLRTETFEGSDPNGWDGEDEGEDDEPPKKKRKPRSDRGKHHKHHKNPKGTPGGNGDGVDDDMLKDALPVEKRRGYSMLLNGMRKRYVNGSIELGNALHDAEAKSFNPQQANTTVQEHISTLEAEIQTNKLSQMNYDTIHERLSYKVTPSKIAKLTGHDKVALRPIEDLAWGLASRDKKVISYAYKQLIDNVGQEDAMRIFAYVIKLIF